MSSNPLEAPHTLGRVEDKEPSDASKLSTANNHRETEDDHKKTDSTLQRVNTSAPATFERTDTLAPTDLSERGSPSGSPASKKKGSRSGRPTFIVGVPVEEFSAPGSPVDDAEKEKGSSAFDDSPNGGLMRSQNNRFVAFSEPSNTDGLTPEERPLPKNTPKFIGRQASFRRRASKRQSIVINGDEEEAKIAAKLKESGGVYNNNEHREEERELNVNESEGASGQQFPLRDKIFLLFEGFPADLSNVAELRRWIAASMLVVNTTLLLVLVSCFSFAVETLPAYWEADNKALFGLECGCIAWFTIDVLARLITTRDRKKFFTTALNIIDIVSVLPFYINFVTPDGEGSNAQALILLRVLRLIRVLRVFKLSKHNQGMQAVFIAVSKSWAAMSLMFFLLFIIMLIGSSAIYFAAQLNQTWDSDRRLWIRNNDGEPSPFQSILHCLWIVIVTLTTTGYGDDYPVSPLVYVIASFLMLLGAFVVAFPTVILSANFHEAHAMLRRRKELAASGHHEQQKKDEDEDEDVLQYVSREHRQEVEDLARQDRVKTLARQYHRNKYMYHLADGAPPRCIIFNKTTNTALYEPLLMLRCNSMDGERHYGFKSGAQAQVHVRENYPAGVVARFQLLLHTSSVHNTATQAMVDVQEREKIPTAIKVEPRPIRTLKVEMHSTHAMLAAAHVVNGKFHDPFGQVPIDVYLPKIDALPVLLKYSMSCGFKFSLSYYDSEEVQMIDSGDLDTCFIQPTRSRRHSVRMESATVAAAGAASAAVAGGAFHGGDHDWDPQSQSVE